MVICWEFWVGDQAANNSKWILQEPQFPFPCPGCYFTAGASAKCAVAEFSSMIQDNENAAAVGLVVFV